MELTVNVSSNATRDEIPDWLFSFIGGYLSAAFFVGIFANGGSLYIFYKFSHLRTPVIIFIIGLLCTDLGMCLFGIPLTASSNFAGKWIWGYELCVFHGFVVYFFGLSSMYILAGMSLTRYVVVTSPLSERSVDYKIVWKCLCLCFLLGLFWTIIPFSGWTKYELEATGTSCAVAYDSKDKLILSYNIAIFICCFLLPVSVISYSYYHIYMTIYYMKNKSICSTQSRQLQQKIQNERKLAKTIVLMIAAFLISWTPYAIVAFWRAFGLGHLPAVATAFPAIFAKSSSVWNPFIYGSCNSRFRGAVREYMPCLRKTIELSPGIPDVDVKYELISMNNLLTTKQQGQAIKSIPGTTGDITSNV